MASALTKLLGLITHHSVDKVRVPEPMDKLQLEAAQERLHTRSAELDESVDELSKMIRRMKRRQTRRKE